MAEAQPDLLEAVILDVGHGCSAVFIDGSEAIVVDAGPGDLVGDTLLRYGVADVVALIVSHRHQDHQSEVPSLLSSDEFRIRRLFINSDPSRNPSTVFEQQLRGAANSAWDRHGTVTTSINHTSGADMVTQNLKVQVLAPHLNDWATGIGGPRHGGATITQHALSAVVKVESTAGRSVLLCADYDYAGLDRLMASAKETLGADVLVYPHHGGRTGAPDEEELARRLAEAVAPKAVVFSNGRNKHDNPRPEVVRGVRTTQSGGPVRVLCTQLSPLCSATTHSCAGRLDPTVGSRGADAGHSCYGSLRIALGQEADIFPFGAANLRFVVDTLGESALCVVRHDA